MFYMDPVTLKRKPCYTAEQAVTHEHLSVGVPQAVAQALIGHDNEAIHQHYITVGFDASKQAVNSVCATGEHILFISVCL
jgi:hypothetical protein